MNEVTNAYEKAFSKTRILFRYPKGENVNKTQFGFHDDSYCYETAPVSLGGDANNFGELLKLAAPSVESRWTTAPIGGELRPEIQETIFEKEPWTGEPGLTWTKMLQKDITVKPKSGDNTVKFFNDTGWAPDLDKISIK